MGIMTKRLVHCVSCGSTGIVRSRFDATFRDDAAMIERMVFNVPADLCKRCQVLYIDPDLLEFLNVSAMRCVFAIESDQIMRESADFPVDEP